MSFEVKLTILLISLFLLFGCGTLRLNPVTADDRIVKPLIVQKKIVTFKESIVWYDQNPPTRGVLFPEGDYPIEAEDGEYLYFKAPKELEYRIFKNGEVIDGRLIPGGMCLNKNLFSMIPAGAYMTVNSSKKTLTFKLGRDFQRMEGNKWIKNF